MHSTTALVVTPVKKARKGRRWTRKNGQDVFQLIRSSAGRRPRQPRPAGGRTRLGCSTGRTSKAVIRTAYLLVGRLPSRAFVTVTLARSLTVARCRPARASRRPTGGPGGVGRQRVGCPPLGHYGGPCA